MKRSSRAPVALACSSLLVLVLIAAGCGSDGGGGFELAKPPKSELSVTQVTFNAGAVNAGQFTCEIIMLRNTGEGDPLEVEDVRLDYTPKTPEEQAAPAFYIEEKPDPGTKIAATGKGGEQGLPEQARIKVCFRKYDDGELRSARLVVSTNDKKNPAITIDLVVEGGKAVLQSSPPEVVFQNVQKGKFSDRSLSLLNTGSKDVRIGEIQLVGDLTFKLLIDPADETSVLEPGAPLKIEPPMIIGPGKSYTMAVRFTPKDDTPQNSTIVVRTAEGELTVPVRGNNLGACVQVEPSTVNFGAKLVGSPASLPVILKSCGKDKLVIRGIRLDPEGDADYELDKESFRVEDVNVGWPSSQAPRTISLNGRATFEVIYTPSAVSKTDKDGSPIPDLTTILVDTNTFEGDVPVAVTGIGTLTPCPTAVITILDGASEVAPQEILRLSAANSVPNSGEIKTWKWDVQRPQGSADVFKPDAGKEEVEFQVNVSGKYTFKLDVKDGEGWSCVPATRQVLVIPDEAIHVELSWDTPLDPDPTDEGKGAGSDMDLHFVNLNNAAANPNGEDLYPPVDGDGVAEGYFDDIWDVFWFSPYQDWGVFGNPDDDPSLDRDDTDGAGPENLNLNVPEAGVTYKVGVHYWNDHEFGRSTPTVNIFLFGQLKLTAKGCPMLRWDMWEAGTIKWPSQDIELWTCNGDIPPADPSGPWPSRPCGGSQNVFPDGSACKLTIIPNYQPEKFVPFIGP